MMIRAMRCSVCGGAQASVVAMSDVEVNAFEKTHAHRDRGATRHIETSCIPEDHPSPVKDRSVHQRGEHAAMLAAGARAVTVAEQHKMPGALTLADDDEPVAPKL